MTQPKRKKDEKAELVKLIQSVILTSPHFSGRVESTVVTLPIYPHIQGYCTS